jgi:hypothetical protein
MSLQFAHRPKEEPIPEGASIRLFHDGGSDRLRMTVEGSRSYIDVRPAWAAPLTRASRYLALLDGKGDEIAMVMSLDELSTDSRQAVERELYSRYRTAQVERILNARQEFGAAYWHVETDRGTRDFVTQHLQENAQWLNDHHLLLIDVDGNRFEIRDTMALDALSRRLLYTLV